MSGYNPVSAITAYVVGVYINILPVLYMGVPSQQRPITILWGTGAKNHALGLSDSPQPIKQPVNYRL